MAKLTVDNGGSVGSTGVLLPFGVALHVGFLARLQSEGRALRFRDRLLADHADGFFIASLLPQKGTPNVWTNGCAD
jgi:hypothetical protein